MERGTGLPLLPLETNVMGDIVSPRRYADTSGTGTRNVTRTLEGHTEIIVVSIHHQLGRPQNHPGDGSLGMPVRDLS